MIAIPVAAFMGSFAMIVGPAPQTWCNHFGHGRPMIAIPTADDCGSLHLTGDGDVAVERSVTLPDPVALTVEVTALRALAEERAETIRDLRARLDAAEARLNRLLLTDQRTA